MSEQPPTPRTESVSYILKQLRASIGEGASVTVGGMLKLFGVRGFAVLLMVLALFNVVIFMIPGISFLFGLPMVILAMQMVFGVPTPIFPAFVRERVIQRSVLHKGLTFGIHYAEKIEPYIKPRFLALTGPVALRLHSVLALALSVMVAVPVPFLNIPPSLGIIALSIGVMQRDGMFIATAYAIAAWSFWLYRSIGHVAQSLVT